MSNQPTRVNNRNHVANIGKTNPHEQQQHDNSMQTSIPVPMLIIDDFHTSSQQSYQTKSTSRRTQKNECNQRNQFLPKRNAREMPFNHSTPSSKQNYPNNYFKFTNNPRNKYSSTDDDSDDYDQLDSHIPSHAPYNKNKNYSFISHNPSIYSQGHNDHFPPSNKSRTNGDKNLTDIEEKERKQFKHLFSSTDDNESETEDSLSNENTTVTPSLTAEILSTSCDHHFSTRVESHLFLPISLSDINSVPIVTSNYHSYDINARSEDKPLHANKVLEESNSLAKTYLYSSLIQSFPKLLFDPKYRSVLRYFSASSTTIQENTVISCQRTEYTHFQAIPISNAIILPVSPSGSPQLNTQTLKNPKNSEDTLKTIVNLTQFNNLIHQNLAQQDASTADHQTPPMMYLLGSSSHLEIWCDVLSSARDLTPRNHHVHCSLPRTFSTLHRTFTFPTPNEQFVNNFALENATPRNTRYHHPNHHIIPSKDLHFCIKHDQHYNQDQMSHLFPSAYNVMCPLLDLIYLSSQYHILSYERISRNCGAQSLPTTYFPPTYDLDSTIFAQFPKQHCDGKSILDIESFIYTHFHNDSIFQSCSHHFDQTELEELDYLRINGMLITLRLFSNGILFLNYTSITTHQTFGFKPRILLFDVGTVYHHHYIYNIANIHAKSHPNKTQKPLCLAGLSSLSLSTRKVINFIPKLLRTYQQSGQNYISHAGLLNHFFCGKNTHIASNLSAESQMKKREDIDQNCFSHRGTFFDSVIFLMDDRTLYVHIGTHINALPYHDENSSINSNNPGMCALPIHSFPSDVMAMYIIPQHLFSTTSPNIHHILVSLRNGSLYYTHVNTSSNSNKQFSISVVLLHIFSTYIMAFNEQMFIQDRATFQEKDEISNHVTFTTHQLLTLLSGEVYLITLNLGCLNSFSDDPSIIPNLSTAFPPPQQFTPHPSNSKFLLYTACPAKAPTNHAELVKSRNMYQQNICNSASTPSIRRERVFSHSSAIKRKTPWANDSLKHRQSSLSYITLLYDPNTFSNSHPSHNNLITILNKSQAASNNPNHPDISSASSFITTSKSRKFPQHVTLPQISLSYNRHPIVTQVLFNLKNHQCIYNMGHIITLWTQHNGVIKNMDNFGLTSRVISAIDYNRYLLLVLYNDETQSFAFEEILL